MPVVRETLSVVADVPTDPAALALDLSFEAFFERERDGLFGALVMISGNRHEAEEIAQDAFIALLERWDRVSRLEDPTGYLYRTAMNVFRKRRRRAAVAVRRAVGLLPRDDPFDQAETRQVVGAALATLSPRQRAALVLTELLGYSSDEAARMMSIRPSTVRALATQGRAALRQTMERSHE
jgi:RNA polymerase sigma-70 factor (ECF subfamily)